MAIKPIEKKVDHAAIATKIGLLVLLVGIGFILGRVTPNKKITPASQPEVLSVESAKVTVPNPGELAQGIIDKSKDVAGQVLGDATDMVGQMASNSATAVSNFIIDKTTAPFIEQLNKLPPDQQAEIKKNICK